MNRFRWSVGVAIATMFLPFIETTAQEFRVETHVFSGDSTLPVSENITLYDGYMVYDFQMAMDESNNAAEIVIFDSRQKSFVLLDLQRKYRTDIHQVTLVKMVEQKINSSKLWLSLKTKKI